MNCAARQVVEVPDVAVLPPRRLVGIHVTRLARRVLAVDRHAERPGLVAGRGGPRPLERLEDVAAFGIVQFGFGVADQPAGGPADAGTQRIAAASLAADALVVVGGPGALVVIGGDGPRRVRVPGHRDLGVGEEPVAEAVAHREGVMVRGDRLAVEGEGGIGVEAVAAGEVDVAEVLVERLVLGDDVDDVADGRLLSRRWAQHLGHLDPGGRGAGAGRHPVELVVLHHLRAPGVDLVGSDREIDGAHGAVGAAALEEHRAVGARPGPEPLGVGHPQPVAAGVAGVACVTRDGQGRRVPTSGDVDRRAGHAGTGATVPELDRVEPGEGDEERVAVGGEGEGVGVGPHRGARGGRHGLDRVQLRHRLVDVEHGDGVVVRVGHEQALAVPAELERRGMVPDADRGDLVGVHRVADVDHRHGAAGGSAPAGLVGPVADVEPVVGGVDGEPEGVEADRHAADDGAGGGVDDRHPAAGLLTVGTGIGLVGGLARGPGDVEQGAVERHGTGVAGHGDPVTDRQGRGRPGLVGEAVEAVVGGERLGAGDVEGKGRGSGELPAEDPVGVAAAGVELPVRGGGQAHEEVGGGNRHRGEVGGVDQGQTLHAAAVGRHDDRASVGRGDQAEREAQDVDLLAGRAQRPTLGGTGHAVELGAGTDRVLVAAASGVPRRRCHRCGPGHGGRRGLVTGQLEEPGRVVARRPRGVVVRGVAGARHRHPREDEHARRDEDGPRPW